MLTTAAIYFIYPTYRFYADGDNLTILETQEIKSKAIKLGLDLQGGMYVLLEIDLATLVEKLSNKLTDELKVIIKSTEQESSSNNINFFDLFFYTSLVFNLIVGSLCLMRLLERFLM